ncbi:sulfotransferase family 2 domain-containing protein [Temperatibacter marinus]|uniref:Sulfotransferase family 2 domain-containing protein n=1 Tax=Temperatibacter marinus TaxID=1456591 RepID=A0AA52HAX9_9PROT|nr:sulfotransferase family 2 domain-containing protein [Temperatibacter marinus]WND03200.1 sulfotransferase family 2 domain-containing protein [Temperatibacter marinus]
MPIFTRNNSKIFFVHIPKTGGTYVEDLFRANGFQVHFWKPRRLLPVEAISQQHYHLDILKNIFYMESFDYKFVTVRHPVKRLISEYKMRNPDQEVEINSWIDDTLDQASQDPSYLDNHLRPQHEFHQEGIDIFKQEDGFDAAWASRLEAAIQTDLPHKLVKRRRDNRDFHQSFDPSQLEQRVLEKIKSYYQKDFDYFDYD